MSIAGVPAEAVVLTKAPGRAAARRRTISAKCIRSVLPFRNVPGAELLQKLMI
jgi:hypothetical protein